jgi:hypothetical protein
MTPGEGGLGARLSLPGTWRMPWEVVRETNKGLLERRLIDMEYLQLTNFRVVYP